MLQSKDVIADLQAILDGTSSLDLDQDNSKFDFKGWLERSKALSKFSKELAVVFGRANEEVQKIPPKDLQSLKLDLSHQEANNIEEYVTLVEELPKEFSFEIDHQITQAEGERGMHQDIRDVERDTFQIFSDKTLSGSRLKYNGILETLITGLQTQIPTLFMPSTKEKEAVKTFAKEILRCSNRTNSGGVSFDKFLQIFSGQHTDHFAVFAPDAKRSGPITISHTTTEHNENNFYGLQATISANTWYSILDANNLALTLGRVEITYEHIVGIEFPIRRFDGIDAARISVFNMYPRLTVKTTRVHELQQDIYKKEQKSRSFR